MSRVLRAEMAAVLLGLSLVELAALLLEMRTSVILDWFIATAPLIWINVSAFFLYALFRQLRDPSLAATGGGRLVRLFRPNFPSLASSTSTRRFRRTWIAASLAYGLVYAYLQGMIVFDLSGSLIPAFTLLQSPIGYGPGLAWAPAATFGLVIRPYTLVAAAALSSSSGLVLALLMSYISASRRVVRALPGPLVGFGVLCPTCMGTPATGLLLAYIAPAAGLGGLGATSILSSSLTVSTALLLATLIMLWATLAWLSRLPLGRVLTPSQIV